MVVAGDHPHAECRERSCGDWGKRVRIKLKKIKDIYILSSTKILQKSGIQKNEVIELIYRGFI